MPDPSEVCGENTHDPLTPTPHRSFQNGRKATNTVAFPTNMSSGEQRSQCRWKEQGAVSWNVLDDTVHQAPSALWVTHMQLACCYLQLCSSAFSYFNQISRVNNQLLLSLITCYDKIWLLPLTSPTYGGTVGTHLVWGMGWYSILQPFASQSDVYPTELQTAIAFGGRRNQPWLMAIVCSEVVTGGECGGKAARRRAGKRAGYTPVTSGGSRDQQVSTGNDWGQQVSIWQGVNTNHSSSILAIILADWRQFRIRQRSALKRVFRLKSINWDEGRLNTRWKTAKRVMRQKPGSQE